MGEAGQESYCANHVQPDGRRVVLRVEWRMRERGQVDSSGSLQLHQSPQEMRHGERWTPRTESPPKPDGQEPYSWVTVTMFMFDAPV